MPTCSTCVFWKRTNRLRRKDVNYCDKLTQGDDYSTLVVDVKVLDDSGLDVTVVTGPNFGCVLHQHK